MATAEDAIESMLRKFFEIAVRSADTDERWKAVIAFCETVVREPQGPVVAVRFLAREMQSTNEAAAVKALDILEACVRQCGPRFQTEVGKFRFLNEVVKLVSPRYLGNTTTVKVKSKAVELLCAWTQLLPHEPKIREAHVMLKNQKLINEDMDVPLCTNVTMDGEPYENGAETRCERRNSASVAGARRSDDIFTNDERSQRLKKLLQSKNPHDLQEANKLIKRMVSENEQKQAKASWRASELGRVQTIVGVLSEMLSAYRPTASSEEKETLKQLYSSCKELRTGLPKIADQTEDAEKEALVNIVKASEDLDAVIKDYEFIVEGRGSPSAFRKAMPKTSEPSALLDLDLLNLSSGEGDSPSDREGKQLLDPGQMLEEVFGVPAVPPRLPPKGNVLAARGDSNDYLLLADFTSGSSPSLVPGSNPRPAMAVTPLMSGAVPSSRYMIDLSKPASTAASETKVASSASSVFEDIEKMARERLPLGKPAANPVDAANTMPLASSAVKEEVKGPSSSVPSTTLAAENMTCVTESRDPTTSTQSTVITPREPCNLDKVTLSLDDVKPGEGSPTVLFDTDDVSLTLSSAVVDSRPELSVGVLTFANKSKLPVTEYVFKAVFNPKTVPIRVLKASGTELPPSRPFVPPPVVTQLIVVHNPGKVPLSMKFVVCFTKGDDLESERGMISNFLS